MRIWYLILGSLLTWLPLSCPAAEDADHPFLQFITRQAQTLRANDKPPASAEAWEKQRAGVRDTLKQIWGEFPSQAAPLSPKVLGTFERDGYRVEKLIFQTFSNVWMTANVYVPTAPGPHPAILAVHGHWKGAKQDPVVQSRCISSVRHGFVVLAVDAFGAGERGIGKELGEYHGEMTAATLLPIGRPLSGIQVYENMRAVDYLRSRPEVDPNRIGITGASGGGNQSMYSGAWDDRLRSVVPVCSVGNYQAYLGAACCLCEVVPGILKSTEEWGILAQTSPRALMVINASKDVVQFSPEAATNSLALVQTVYALHNKPENLSHRVFDSGHDYNSAMRQAMNGWMLRHLNGKGDGSPVPESAIQVEDPEALRCFPGKSRPDDWITLPVFAQREAQALLAQKTLPSSPQAWKSIGGATRQALLKRVLGDFPPLTPLGVQQQASADGKKRTLQFLPEPGLTLTATQEFGTSNAPLAILLDLNGAAAAATNAVAAEIRAAGWSLITFDLRGTGAQSWKKDQVGGCPDHNTAEWSLWIGRPLLGQWTWDVRRLIDTVFQADRRLPSRIVVIGQGPAGLVALSAGVLDPRVSGVATLGSLASYVSDRPYKNQRLGIIAPGILREVGDIAHMAALAAPKRLILADPVFGNGDSLTESQLKTQFEPTHALYSLLQSENRLSVVKNVDAKALMGLLALP